MKQKQGRVLDTDAFLIAGGAVLAWEVPIVDTSTKNVSAS